MLVNFLIFLGVFSIMVFLSYFYKHLFEIKDKRIYVFKLSKTKFKTRNHKIYAVFSISLKNKNFFFVDFPVLFRFYGDTRFKAKVKIKYEALRSNRDPEELVDRVIQFETKTIECKRRITDIIVGEIEIEIEINPYYGYPIMEFEILQNNFCNLKSPVKKIIKFPKKDL